MASSSSHKTSLDAFDVNMPLTEDEAANVLDCIDHTWHRACFFLPASFLQLLIDGTSCITLTVLRCFDRAMNIIGLKQPLASHGTTETLIIAMTAHWRTGCAREFFISGLQLLPTGVGALPVSDLLYLGLCPACYHRALAASEYLFQLHHGREDLSWRCESSQGIPRASSNTSGATQPLLLSQVSDYAACSSAPLLRLSAVRAKYGPPLPVD
eukprot:TRINITY_DN11605_c3_g1_i10.p1 TRINITY_DN11605_c3_g1~~TRINITY_DN11605_c3_g1_i10.p1  ORF type:complete len:212 (+),score=13.48 TRINITY_DN11605_c3_g1_i10:134-769(+)